MCPPPSCPSHDVVFASSNNNNNTTTSDNGNSDYNSCTQPMAQWTTVSDDTQPPHHKPKNTHEPRTRGALAMAHGVPYISSTSGSNMGCIAARLHMVRQDRQQAREALSNEQLTIRGAEGLPVSMAQHVSCTTVAENHSPTNPTPRVQATVINQCLAAGTSSALLLPASLFPLVVSLPSPAQPQPEAEAESFLQLMQQDLPYLLPRPSLCPTYDIIKHCRLLFCPSVSLTPRAVCLTRLAGCPIA